MDHDLAIKDNVAERYLLGELNEVEMEEYEEHFFSCAVCAQEVKLGSEFIDHAREVFKTDFLQERAEPVKMSTTWGRFWKSLLQPAPAFACALFAIVGGFSLYQNSVITDLKKPEMFASEAKMLRASRRGANEEQVNVQPGQPFRIAFQIPAIGDFRSYIVEILDGAGVRQSSISVTTTQAKNTIQIKFRSGSLRQGNYTAVIEGVTGNSRESAAKQEVVRYPFSVNIQGQ